MKPIHSAGFVCEFGCGEPYNTEVPYPVANDRLAEFDMAVAEHVRSEHSVSPVEVWTCSECDTVYEDKDEAKECCT